MTGASPHTRNDSINLKPPELFDCIGTGDDELVRGVVLVGGDQQSAAEAGTGFADRAAECVVSVGGREPFRVGHRREAASTPLRILIASNES